MTMIMMTTFKELLHKNKYKHDKRIFFNIVSSKLVHSYRLTRYIIQETGCWRSQSVLF